MKKMLLFAVAAVMMMLSACTNDNTCVKQIVEVINAGYIQHQAIDNGELQISDIPEADFFNWPYGNIFANEKIYAIIEKNAEYKLTDTDKELLNNSVEQFIKDSTEMDDAAIVADHAKDTIRSAKKLKDLYAHGSTF